MTDGTADLPPKAPAPGISFGPYDIIESLGAGGMGEVYRARDSKLQRDVALKFLPEELSSDEQLLARFDREAKLLALVNHPNIATIHSIEEENGHPFLVLELVEGETLSKRLKSGPMPIGPALKVCRDIAAALEAAHHKGIVHRDLKPANVIVTSEGVVKVLDFGIAKPLKFGQAATDLADDSPSEELTVTGTLVGTGPYMSPEQIRGREAGTRVDVWAFGCLMYQVLTGRAAFGRDTLADTLTSILEREPDWERLPAKTPESIRRLLKRCMTKDPSQRLQAIGDARIEIDETIRTPSKAQPVTLATTAIPGWQLAAGAATLLVVGVLVGALLAGVVSNETVPRPSAEYSDLTFPSGVVLGLGGAPPIAASRDGTRFVAVFRDGRGQQLWRRDVNWSSGWASIAGTDGAESPFFSFEGDEIGFFANGYLYTIPYEGAETAVRVGDALVPHGGAWTHDDSIYYSSNQSIWVARADARAAELVVAPDPLKGEIALRWPVVLPDGQSVVYTGWAGLGNDDTSVYLLEPRGEPRLLVADAGFASYSPSEHLVFVRGDELYAIPFDPNALTIEGDEFPLSDQVLVRADNGVPFFALAQQAGTLLHAPGDVLTPGPVLAWMAANEQSVPVPEILDGYHEGLLYPRLSPDASRLAIEVQNGSESAEAGIADLDEGGGVAPVAAGGMTSAPEWSVDGKRIAYMSHNTGNVLVKDAYSGAPGAALTDAAAGQFLFPTGWSSSGAIFYTAAAYSVDLEEMVYDIWYTTDAGGAAPLPFLDSDADEYGATPSPDGNWVAYVQGDRETDETQVWVTSFPDKSVYRQPISTGTDCQEAAWSGDGRQLYFRCASRMMAVDVRTVGQFDASDRRTLWDWGFALDDQRLKANYDYNALSKRFLMVSDDPIVTAVDLKMVQFWGELLRAHDLGRQR